MKNLFTLGIIFLFSGFVFSQTENTLKNDTLYLQKGGYLVVGQNLKLGKGTKDNGYFKYIEVSTSSMFRTVNTSGNNWGVQDANALSSQYNDLEGNIIRFEERGNKRTGKKYVAIIGIGEAKRYQVDIDNAATSGEIVLDGYQSENTSVNSEPSKNISVADELLKLKELKDAGVLTEEEFNAQKEKILSGQ